MQLPEGIAFHYLFYPNYQYRRPRERTIATLRPGNDWNSAFLVDEWGELTGPYPFTRDGWRDISTYVANRKMTVFCRFSGTALPFGWLQSALEDPRARVLATSSRGPVGVSLRHGNRRGSFAGVSGYHDEELSVHLDTPEGFAALRRVERVVGVGTHDSAASFGTAVLYRYWKQAEIPHLVRLPEGLQNLLLRYRNGGRISTVTDYFGDADILDLRRAYPSVVGAGLPWGHHVFHGSDALDYCRRQHRPCFAVYHVAVHEHLDHSPVPFKDFTDAHSRWTFALPAGHYAEWGLWDDEAIALIETGKVTLEWRYGWSWECLSTVLKPWVDEMDGYREFFEQRHDTNAAKIVKNSSNAAIGRWGVLPERVEMVTIQDSVDTKDYMELHERTWQFRDLEPGESPNWLFHKSTENLPYVPSHLCSYVRMKVRLAIYDLGVAARQRGHQVIMENVDEIVTSGPIADCLPPTFTGKELHVTNAWTPATRSLIAQVWRGDHYDVYERLPGRHGEERDAIRYRWSESIEQGRLIDGVTRSELPEDRGERASDRASLPRRTHPPLLPNCHRPTGCEPILDSDLASDTVHHRSDWPAVREEQDQLPCL